jgi:hypothetical protein
MLSPDIPSYWFDVLREITSSWFEVQKRANFQQLFCATCRFPHSYLTYVQFAAGIMNYFLLGQEGRIRYLGGMLTDKQCYVKYVTLLPKL